jgi:hypothetical protein
MRELLQFLDRLDDARIAYHLEHVRDSVMIAVAVPGERWEIEFFDDGHVEIEIFRSDGTIIHDPGRLEELLTLHAS